jgi:cell division protein FtsX
VTAPLRLLASFALRALASRPTLTLLALILLTLSATLIASIAGSLYFLSSLRGSLLSDLAVEIELTSDSTKQDVYQKLSARRDVQSSLYLTPSEVLHEIERETGESVRDLLQENPFPPLIRVKLRAPTLAQLDVFVADVKAWPGVLDASYPKRLWERLDQLAVSLRGKFGMLAGLFALLAWSLVGLTLRAMLRYRQATWELLLQLGLHPRDLSWIKLMMEIALGLLAGVVSALALYGLAILAGWALLQPVEVPYYLLGATVGGAVALAVLAGLWIPSRALTESRSI